ncbi:MAG: hypothetical protein IJ387_12360, partial [Thermoguttaceae bacterium]|nr:hypothetical protein [Thermoguttaceae bacterium]
ALLSALIGGGFVAAQDAQPLAKSDVASTAPAAGGGESIRNGDAPSRPVPIVGKIASLGVFKNGIAVVEERFEVPGPGRYATSTPPSPLHGTFFIESDGVVETTSTVDDVEIPISEAMEIDWTQDFSGRKVRVVLPGESEPRELRIVPTGRSVDGETASDGASAYAASRWNGAFSSALSTQTSGVSRSNVGGVLFATDDGETIWVNDAAEIKVVSTAPGEGPTTVWRKRPRLIFDVKPSGDGAEKGETGKTGPTTIRLFYLTRGATWAPQYRVRLLDSKTLEIEQNAILANEWRAFEGTPVALFSGFPQIATRDALSPMAPSVDLNGFFTSLTSGANGAAGLYARGGGASMLTQQALTLNAVAPTSSGTGGGFGAASGDEASFGDGVDVFAQAVGRKTLAKNDRTLFSVARKTAPYRRVVCWDIADIWDENGRRRDPSAFLSDGGTNVYGRTTSGENLVANGSRFSEPWDALQFANPFDFPTTTGPATVVDGARFLGQNPIYWTNPGETTLLPITKALSVRVRSVENERSEYDAASTNEVEPRSNGPENLDGLVAEIAAQRAAGNVANGANAAPKSGNNGELRWKDVQEIRRDLWGRDVRVLPWGNCFRVAVIDAEIEIANNRDEETTVLLSRQFSGVALPESFEGFGEPPKITVIGDAASGYAANRVNRRQEMRWTTTLKPGEKRTLKFSFQTLIWI